LPSSAERKEGIAAMFEGLTGCQASGARIARRYFLANLVDAHRRAGRPQDGLAFMDGTLPPLDDAFSDSEVARARAELLLIIAPNAMWGRSRPAFEQRPNPYIARFSRRRI
jgi:hypothetical protein